MKRVVRSTLAAEAYGVSEAVENGLMVCQLLDELNFGIRKLSLEKVDEATKTELIVATDSRNLESTIPKDTTAVL